MSGPGSFSSLLLVLCTLTAQTQAQSCTALSWLGTAGNSIDTTLTRTLNFDKNVDTFCKPTCITDSTCITFDEEAVGGSPSCYFTPDYRPVVDNAASTHWIYQRSCTSVAAKTCAFQLIGEFQLPTVTVTATSLEDCLQKCVDSATCAVASYGNSLCRHAPDELQALADRSQTTGWSQYVKGTCDTTTTTSSTTTAFRCSESRAVSTGTLLLSAFVLSAVLACVHHLF